MGRRNESPVKNESADSSLENDEFFDRVRNIGVKVRTYLVTLLSVTFSPTDALFRADLVSPATFLAVSSAITYLLYLLVFPKDPLTAYELPPHVKPLVSAFLQIPLTIPVIVLLNLLFAMLGPWAAFRLFSSSLSFRKAFNIYAYFQGGPATLALWFVAVWALLAIAVGVDVRIWVLYLAWMFGAVIGIVWLTVTFSRVTMRRRFTCLLLISLGDLFGSVIFLPVDIGRVAQAYVYPSSAMAKTLQEEDKLLANTMIFKYRKPKRGEIVAFKLEGEIYVDRIIGLPGETVTIIDKKLSINEVTLLEPYATHADPFMFPKNEEDDLTGHRDNYGPLVVPSDSYFVLGDNRDNAVDSRVWGAVPASNLVGLVYYRYWPFSSAGPFGNSTP